VRIGTTFYRDVQAVAIDHVVYRWGDLRDTGQPMTTVAFPPDELGLPGTMSGIDHTYYVVSSHRDTLTPYRPKPTVQDLIPVSAVEYLRITTYEQSQAVPFPPAAGAGGAVIAQVVSPGPPIAPHLIYVGQIEGIPIGPVMPSPSPSPGNWRSPRTGHPGPTPCPRS
ncbi:MAG TPA: hypothetical protein VMW49_04065, partial [Candidatus Dormibacteraeota bacterium]|nr:hypothetical protein [Candidatus Dormibacteraeota bacterium]